MTSRLVMTYPITDNLEYEGLLRDIAIQRVTNLCARRSWTMTSPVEVTIQSRLRNLIAEVQIRETLACRQTVID